MMAYSNMRELQGLQLRAIIEIGFKPERLEEATKLADIKNISAGFRIGKSGSIIIIENDKIISSGITKQKILQALKKR